MKNAILGTWKAVGSLNEDGSMNNKKAPVKFTFKEDGKGVMKMLFLAGAFSWDEENGTYTVRNQSTVQTMKIKDDMLISYPQKGNPCVFQRA